jgi:hypothetical protein
MQLQLTDDAVPQQQQLVDLQETHEAQLYPGEGDLCSAVPWSPRRQELISTSILEYAGNWLP